jgi:glyoxylase-like metal-dependent hydrolase (beta-lactamase superfamily II)
MRSDDAINLSRRVALAGLALTAGPLLQPSLSRAALAPSRQQVPGLYRFRIGLFELTAINDGVWNVPIDDKFVRNVPLQQVQQAMAAAFLPTIDRLPLPFTALLVNTGPQLVLIDTGTGGQIAATAGLLETNLRAGGVAAEAIDTIVISHFHPDHINGLKTKDDALVFPNAEILVPQAEWEFFMDEANLRAAPEVLKGYLLNARRIFKNLAKRLRYYVADKEVAPGITAVFAPGHTPGHHAFVIASGDQSLMVLSDTATHPALFVRHPHWQVALDMDGAAAEKTRNKIFDRVAADRMLVTGYHFPFPACGHIATSADGYEFYPRQWASQL